MNRESKAGMEPLSPTRFALLLHSVPHLGEKTLTRLLHFLALHRLDPETCLTLSAEEWQTRYELDPRAATYLCEHREALLAKSEELARTVRQHHLHVFTAQSLTYPDRLERFADVPPPVIYALGSLSLLDQNQPPLPTGNTESTSRKDQIGVQNEAAKLYTINANVQGQKPTSETPGNPGQNTARAPFTFSIATSNGATPQTLARQDEIATELIRRGCVPVTGHDRAAYRRLALAAQRLNRPTLYVMDRGLREALGPDFDRPPFAAARIRETVFESTRDLALSPFRLDDHALGANLRTRDHLVYALADLIVALDVRAGGGMAAECLRAHAQGRMVWVVAGGRDGNEELRRAGCPPMP